METTGQAPAVRWSARQQAVVEMRELSAHLNAATARWLGRVLECRRRGVGAGDDFAVYLAWSCGISLREAREFLRVGEALEELPLMRAAFERGELSFSRIRHLTRVATTASEEGLLALAVGLTASQLERALRVFRRVQADEAAESHELEYVDYFWDEDGSLVLRARLAAEDGVVLVRALEAARERVRDSRPREVLARLQRERETMTPQRSVDVEALLELAERSLGRSIGEDEPGVPAPQVVVHVDAAALTADESGRCELEDGPVISAETARRLGCDCEQVASVERDGIPVTVGRKRRTVPPRLRRLLEARDRGVCQWPGCDRRRYLAAHHRRHWAHGGETSLDNLVLLCSQHHRLVHEGGWTIEQTEDAGLRFRNRYAVVGPTAIHPPTGSADQLIRQNSVADLQIDEDTNRTGDGVWMDLALTVDAIADAFRPP